MLILTLYMGPYLNNENDKHLITIDGQQRLTTLFLLFWYFNLKENANLNEILSNFSYETRISAEDFTRTIVQEALNFGEINGENLSTVLIEKKVVSIPMDTGSYCTWYVSHA